MSDINFTQQSELGARFFGPNVEFGWSEKADGPMNYVGHEEFDRDRRENRKKFLAIKGASLEQTSVPKLYHGARAVVVGAHNSVFGSGLMCDAIITDKKGLVLTISMADCPPVFLYDPQAEVIALVHAGWKPVAGGILENTVKKMVDELNCDPKIMRAFVGPGICWECYEVGEDLVEKFGILGQVNKSFYPCHHNPKKHHFDLKKEIIKRLADVGLDMNLIQYSLDCTKHTVDMATGKYLYFSWRREKKNDPLDCQMAVIMMK